MRRTLPLSISIFDVEACFRKLLKAVLTGGTFSSLVSCIPTPRNSSQGTFMRSNSDFASLNIVDASLMGAPDVVLLFTLSHIPQPRNLAVSWKIV